MTCLPHCRNTLKAPAPGAVQGAHSAPASPQPQDPGCAHRAPLPVSGTPPCRVPWSSRGTQSQSEVWDHSIAQGMLTAVPGRQEEPSAHALLCQTSSCWGVMKHDDLGHLKCSQSHPAARRSDRRFRSKRHSPVGCKLHPVPQKRGKKPKFHSCFSGESIRGRGGWLGLEPHPKWDQPLTLSSLSQGAEMCRPQPDEHQEPVTSLRTQPLPDRWKRGA